MYILYYIVMIKLELNYYKASKNNLLSENCWALNTFH